MLGPKRARYKSSVHPDPSVAGWGSPEPPARGGGRVCVRVPSTASAGAERGCPAAGAHAGGEYRQPLAPPPAALLFLPGRFGPEERHRRCRGIPRRSCRCPTETARPPGVLQEHPSPRPPHLRRQRSPVLLQELFPEHAALDRRELQEGTGPEPGCLQAHGQEFGVSHEFSETLRGQSKATARGTRDIASSALYPPAFPPPFPPPP